MMSEKTTQASIFGSFGFAMLGTTCCALPMTLVTLGMGSAVASLVSAAPWLVTLSEYKLYTFTITGLLIAYSWWQFAKVSQCNIEDAKKSRWQKWMLIFSTAIFSISLFAAFAMYPIMRVLDGA